MSKLARKMGSASAALPGRIRRTIQRVAFDVLYRYGGRIYDRLTVLLFGESWDEWRRSVLPLLDTGPVLDLGSGTGALLYELKELDIAAFGIDRSPSMLRAARARLGSGTLVRSDVMHLPFMDEAFNVCVSTFPGPFILLPGVQEEVARVLRPGGRLIVMFSGESKRGGVESRPRPLRFLLRLFYGGEKWPEAPVLASLNHGALTGDWVTRELNGGKALLWIAQKVAKEQEQN